MIIRAKIQHGERGGEKSHVNANMERYLDDGIHLHNLRKQGIQVCPQ